MKKALLTLLVCLALLPAFAHNNEPGTTKLISGKVIDKQTGEALSGVKIQVDGTDTFCYTDLNGSYILPLKSKEKGTVSISMTGYASLKMNPADGGLEHDLYLDPR